MYNYVSENGAVLHLTGNSRIAMTSSTFSSNNAAGQGSALYLLGTGSNTIRDWSFISNSAINGNTLMFLFANTLITNITVKDNSAGIDSSGIFTTFSEIQIASSTFKTETFPNGATTLLEASNDSNNMGLFISISAGATVTITGTSFENGYADSGGFIYMSGNSYLSITGSTFSTSSVGNDGGAIYASGFKTISISSCSFTSTSAQRDGSVIYLNSGTSTISSSNFTVEPGLAPIYTSGGNFTGTNLILNNGNISNTKYDQDVLGGGIYASNSENFQIAASTFNNLNYGGKGGAIYLTATTSMKESSIPVQPVYTITSSTFNSNSAMYGGAIYADNVDYAQINSCTFSNNKAVTYQTMGGDGGSVYYASSGKLLNLL